MKKSIIISLLVMFLGSCAEIEPKPFEPSAGHIETESAPKPSNIPPLVEQEPILPAPKPAPNLEKYTVVVNEVPVRELLFALARDAEVNVDIAPGIEGNVTLNAVEQSLPQILDRISRQVDIRYQFENDNLMISADEPYLRSYVIDYVNMSRDTSISNKVATQIQSTSGGGDVGGSGGSSSSTGNNSTTDVNSSAFNFFWRTLSMNILAILGDEDLDSVEDDKIPVTTAVIPNPEAGIIAVRATESEHKQIQKFIDTTLASVQRQVLIRVTIAEVQLSDQYQAGVDWSFLAEAGKAGFDIISTTLSGVPLGTVSSFVLDYEDPNTNRDRLDATVRLLDEFGNVKIMSSPQTMVLNNQTALLKVVENVVYFEVDVEAAAVPAAAAGNLLSQVAIDTDAATVPVGIVMSVTPQISQNGQISLNVRPTISRVTGFVNDPNPELANAGVTNPVPQIEVREIESMLRLVDGQIAVLGGLMQDTNSDTDRGLPLISDVPGVGNAFKTTNKDYKKTELVIFIQPVIVENPSIDGDLDSYQPFLNSQVTDNAGNLGES